MIQNRVQAKSEHNKRRDVIQWRREKHVKRREREKTGW